MDRATRRDFLVRVSGGALAASLGPALARELGLLPRAWADDEVDRLTFGALEPLVATMVETPLEQLLPKLIEKLRAGVTLEDLVAAGALANACTFGGEDYVGFHTMAALGPAYRIALELPEASRPLPVLKVLYRNTQRIHESGGAKRPVLRRIPDLGDGAEPTAESLREAVRARDVEGAERQLSRLAAARRPTETLDRLLLTVEDVAEVHRAVVAYRAYDLLRVTGEEHALVLLRQSVRYCVKSEANVPERYRRSRELLPKLLEELHLLDGSKEGAAKKLDDAALEALARTIFEAADPADAARAAASALAEGLAKDQLGEALSLAANQLVLRDRGRSAREVQAGKPLGSVHGDSIGVHACDSANAWRNLARAAGPRHSSACLVLAAYQVAFDRINRGGDFLGWEPHPLKAQLEKVRAKEPAELVRELDGAIREQDQARAAAIVHRSGELGHEPAPILDVLRRYAVSEDGALHAEKYFRTVTEELAANRPAFRTRQLVALARVTASEFGRTAPGIEEARRLLGS